VRSTCSAIAFVGRYQAGGGLAADTIGPACQLEPVLRGVPGRHYSRRQVGTAAVMNGSTFMETFTYAITDLIAYQSDPIVVALEREEALEFGIRMARELAASEPDLLSKGLCITVRDDEGDAISIVPLDTIQ